MYVGNKQTLSTNAPIHINHLPVRGHLAVMAAPSISMMGKGKSNVVIATPLRAANPALPANQHNLVSRLPIFHPPRAIQCHYIIVDNFCIPGNFLISGISVDLR
jgi:hypothetical protein